MSGDGPDLLFLHGGSHGSWCWRPLIQLLEDSRYTGRLIALDMPGCGAKRGQHAAAETLGSIAAALNAELRSAGIDHAALIGHSIAGALMPIMAAADPALFSRLIFLAASAPNEGESVAGMMGTGVHGEDPAKVGFPLDPKTTPVADLCLAMFGPDLSEPQLASLMKEVALDVTPPALFQEPVSRDNYPAGHRASYILTTRDPILPPAWQRRFADRLACEAVIDLDAPHEPFLSHPSDLAAVLLRILAA